MLLLAGLKNKITTYIVSFWTNVRNAKKKLKLIQRHEDSVWSRKMTIIRIFKFVVNGFHRKTSLCNRLTRHDFDDIFYVCVFFFIYNSRPNENTKCLNFSCGVLIALPPSTDAWLACTHVPMRVGTESPGHNRSITKYFTSFFEYFQETIAWSKATAIVMRRTASWRFDFFSGVMAIIVYRYPHSTGPQQNKRDAVAGVPVCRRTYTENADLARRKSRPTVTKTRQCANITLSRVNKLRTNLKFLRRKSKRVRQFVTPNQLWYTAVHSVQITNTCALSNRYWRGSLQALLKNYYRDVYTRRASAQRR